MPKQHLEGILTRSLKHINVWYLKLQVNPMAHTTMPADYIVLTNSFNYLIECKETKTNRFDFKRLTQCGGLINFMIKGDKFKSYVMIMFWKGSVKKSSCFLIPMEAYIFIEREICKKSINLNDCNKYFSQFKVNYLKGSLLDMFEVIK